MENPTTTAISRSINKGQNDWNLDAIYRMDIHDPIGGHLTATYKVKVDIRRNFYDFQSHARISVFDPQAMKWNHLAHIPYADMESMACSSVQDRPDVEWCLELDENDLLRMAYDILA